jgi:hypothetical protein
LDTHHASSVLISVCWRALMIFSIMPLFMADSPLLAHVYYFCDLSLRRRSALRSLTTGIDTSTSPWPVPRRRDTHDSWPVSASGQLPLASISVINFTSVSEAQSHGVASIIVLAAFSFRFHCRYSRLSETQHADSHLAATRRIAAQQVFKIRTIFDEITKCLESVIRAQYDDIGDI